mmetsp:Transcript_17624/g.26405  ORF Transcript_17624/g.26405 Transcript_17624/m.26405 type:complete len:453 (+) Transcript_17624:29-1387(+)
MTSEGLSVPSPTPKPEDLPTAVFDGVLPKHRFADLKRDFIRLVWECTPPPEDESAFVTGTYWHPLDSKYTPINGIDRAIRHITRELAKRNDGIADIMKEAQGCEWWFQEQGPKDVPKEFHTDVNIIFDKNAKDDSAEKTKYHYPMLSSVFYFGSSVADTIRYPHLTSPTVVFGQAPRPTKSIEHILMPRIPRKALVCYPSPNRLLLFEGDLWHAVVSPPEEEKRKVRAEELQAQVEHGSWETDTRYTLLINWWSKKPVGPRLLGKEFKSNIPSNIKLRSNKSIESSKAKIVFQKEEKEPATEASSQVSIPREYKITKSKTESNVLKSTHISQECIRKEVKTVEESPETMKAASIVTINLRHDVDVKVKHPCLEVFKNQAKQWLKQQVPHNIHKVACTKYNGKKTCVDITGHEEMVIGNVIQMEYPKVAGEVIDELVSKNELWEWSSGEFYNK